ncbi:MAG: glycosyltransferase [Parvularculaceae bacterium]
MSAPAVAVILPCYNEAAAIGDVVASFRKALPAAIIYVYDNASTDDTAAVARAAGAVVRFEPEKGKGAAVSRAFADVDADIYVIADGDGTYEAARAADMIAMMRADTLDMVVGVRADHGDGAYRRGHVFGNRVFSLVFRALFRSDFTDILSGYRVLSRRFVKSFPSRAKGFEIELEMSTHAALLRLPTREAPTSYSARPEGGESKLNTWLDGAAIMRRMFRFLRLYRPRFVYGVAGILVAGVGFIFFTPIVAEFMVTSEVRRLPTLIVSVSVMVTGVMLFFAGAILDAQAQHFAETKRLAYLRIAPPSPAPLPDDAA